MQEHKNTSYKMQPLFDFELATFAMLALPAINYLSGAEADGKHKRAEEEDR